MEGPKKELEGPKSFFWIELARVCAKVPCSRTQHHANGGIQIRPNKKISASRVTGSENFR